MSTYQAAVLVAPRTLELQTRHRRALQPTEVRLGITRVGVCGTDLALWSGSYPVPLPMVPGHELVGRVLEIGTAVTESSVGDRVTAEINATCLTRRAPSPCIPCRRGLQSHCTARTVVGIIGHDGAFAQEVVVPVGTLHALPASLNDARAAFVEPLAAALQTFEMAGDPAGQHVLVLGPGRLGALIVAVARDLGATVGAVARSEASRQRALRFGAHAVFAPTEREAITTWSGGIGADLVVEVTGDATQIDTALDLVRPRGTIAVKSTPGTPPTIDLTRLVVDEVRLVGSRCGPFERAIRWLSETSWPVQSLVEATFPLDHTAEAFEAATRLTKVAVLP